MKFIWYTVLVRAIPESLGVVLLTLAVVNEKRDTSKVLFTSVLCGMATFTMRMLPLKFGIHSMIGLVLQVFMINIILNIKFQKILKGLLVSMLLLSFSEVVTIIVMQYVMKLNPEAVYADPVYTMVSGVPSVAVLYIAAFIINKINNRKYRSSL